MLLSTSKEQIEQNLLDEAVRYWGTGRAEALKSDINRVAGWLALISQHELEMDMDEPDFLVSASSVEEDR